MPGWIQVTIQFENQRELVGKFLALGQGLYNLSGAWEKVGTLLQDDWGQQFADEGGYLGPQVGPEWKPLAPSTVMQRERLGYGGQHMILQRTGQLKASVIERGALGNVFEVAPDHVTVGTDWPIAAFHQHGTSRMPARTMLGLKWESRAKILRILGDEVRTQAAADCLDMQGA